MGLTLIKTSPAQTLETPITHQPSTELEKIVATPASLAGCDATERGKINETYTALYKEFRKRAYAPLIPARGRAPARPAPLTAQLLRLQQEFRTLLAGRDPESCLIEAGLKEEDACLLLSASSWLPEKARKSSHADVILNNERIVTPSKSNPKLDYVRLFIQDKQGGHYSTLVWLVDRSTQKVVGWVDKNALSLNEYRVNYEINEYRGHEIASSNPELGVNRFDYALRGLKSPMKLQEACSHAGAAYDNFIAQAKKHDWRVKTWNMSRANMTPADERALLREAAVEGLAVGSINLYESGKNVVDGAKFLWDYGRNNPTDDPFEPGQKIGFRDLVNQSLGQMGKKAFDECLQQLCPGVESGVGALACSPVATHYAVSCVGGKIVMHVGKEVADYVVGCLEGRARPEEGIPAGSAAISACLADVAVITASFVPVAGAAKVASVGGQGVYRATLLATKELSPAARKFVRSFTKKVIRGTAGASVGALDLTINQLPSSPKDLKHLETFLREFIKDPSLAMESRKTARELLERVKAARRAGTAQNPDLSREHLKKELRKAHGGSDADWYRDTLEKDLDQALVERSNYQKYLDEGLKPGEHVYWMQQRELKELNEKLWDIGGTEYYLMTLDRELGALMKRHPELGRIVHRNYKDRVIVSSLSSADFEKKVMAPLREKVATEVTQVKDRLGTSYLWQDYMNDSLEVAKGKSIEDAFLNLHLEKQGKSFEAWRSSATEARQQLEKRLTKARPGESLENILRETRRAKGDLQKLEAVLKKKGLPESLAPDLMKYLDELRVADFLPLARPMTAADKQVLELSQAALKADPSNPLLELPRIESVIDESWVFQRSRFLKEAKEARYMVATDIQGLGERAMLAQDRWLLDGAKQSELTQVYSKTTSFLNSRYDEVHKKLKTILGEHATVGLYRSGDDALWSLPDMTIDQKKAVDDLFRAQSDMYHAVVDVNQQAGPEGIADAIHGAREKLFSDKDALKNGVVAGPDTP